MTEDPLGENQEAPFTKFQALRMRHCVVELVRPELSGFLSCRGLILGKVHVLRGDRLQTIRPVARAT